MPKSLEGLDKGSLAYKEELENIRFYGEVFGSISPAQARNSLIGMTSDALEEAVAVFDAILDFGTVEPQRGENRTTSWLSSPWVVLPAETCSMTARFDSKARFRSGVADRRRATALLLEHHSASNDSPLPSSIPTPKRAEILARPIPLPREAQTKNFEENYRRKEPVLSVSNTELIVFDCSDGNVEVIIPPGDPYLSMTEQEGQHWDTYLEIPHEATTHGLAVFHYKNLEKFAASLALIDTSLKNSDLNPR